MEGTPIYTSGKSVHHSYSLCIAILELLSFLVSPIGRLYMDVHVHCKIYGMEPYFLYGINNKNMHV